MIDMLSLSIFALALLLNAGTPGPAVAALVSRVINRGWREVMPFVAALWVGEIIWMTCAVSGLSVLAEQFFFAFLIIKYCGVIYLFWLAIKMWTAPVTPADGSGEEMAPSSASAAKMFLAGLSITLGNPKVMVFYLALLPTLIDMTHVTVPGWGVIALTMLGVLAFVDTTWVALAHRARILLRTPSALHIANRIGAVSMGGAAASIASK